MKTKEQILRWLDKQPWKWEFYEAVVSCNKACKIVYNENLMDSFYWASTKQDLNVWKKRDEEYRKWYHFHDKPMSWKEYCKQNPIQETDWFIDDSCQILPIEGSCIRDYDTSANIMSKKYCEAFVAYMRLIQLRNAWVKDKNLDELQATFKILYQDNKLSIFRVNSSTGLSFSDALDAADFFNTFIDLLEVAKPLL